MSDPDAIFEIDPTTRIISTNVKKIVLMQYDHNSEIFTFSIPQFVEGHDMSLCNKIEIHYTNINKRTREQSNDVYPVTDKQVKDNNLVFTWLLSGNATKYPGSLNFIIRFECVEDDGSISYMWHTDIFKNVTVSDGISNTESVIEDYSDILEQWKSELVETCTDYTNITNAPVKYLKSPDADGNYIILRDLDSGTYILDGAFYLFKTETASQAANFKWNFPVIIGRTTDKTYVQVLYPPRNTIQYVEITDDGFYQNNVNLETVFDDLINEIPQVDYEQNDSTVKDYIKNRPFYTEVTETTLLDGTFDFVQIEEMLYLTLVENFPYSIEEGKKYTVVFDGASYDCIGYIPEEGNPQSVIGNASLAKPSFSSGNNEPFLILTRSTNDISKLNITTNLTDSSHTVKIIAPVETIKKLDEKYIPDTYAKNQSVEEIRNEIPNVPEWAMAETKPTYTAEEVGAMPADTTVVKSVNGTLPDELGNVEIEAGSSSATSLGITGAVVGQIGRITAVDSEGKPTAWEPVDMPSGDKWELIHQGTVGENGVTSYLVNTDMNGNPFSLSEFELTYTIYNPAGYSSQKAGGLGINGLTKSSFSTNGNASSNDSYTGCIGSDSKIDVTKGVHMILKYEGSVVDGYLMMRGFSSGYGYDSDGNIVSLSGTSGVFGVGKWNDIVSKGQLFNDGVSSLELIYYYDSLKNATITIKGVRA